MQLRQKDERIDAGEAMWLMEATGNYQYNRNAKYKKDVENLTLDFELSFKLEQDETKQATLSESEVMEEVKVLHATIESRAKSMKRLPRLVDYEIASVKDGIVNFKVEVILVRTELRDSYDETKEYGLPELSKAYAYSNNVFNVANYDCASPPAEYLPITGLTLAGEYADAVADCLEDNYGQYFATNVQYYRSHWHGGSYEGNPHNGNHVIYCYDDGSYDEYAMKGEFDAHSYYHPDNLEDYGKEAIDLWNGDIATHPHAGSQNIPNYISYSPQVFSYGFLELNSNPYWCIRGVRIGVSYSFSD